MRKRILSLLLCVVLCLSLMPTMAFAAEPTPITEVIVTYTTPMMGDPINNSDITVTTVPADAADVLKTSWRLPLGPAGAEFEENSYFISAQIKPKSGYAFEYDSEGDYTGSVTYNGNNCPDKRYSYVRNDCLTIRSDYMTPVPATRHNITFEIEGSGSVVFAGLHGDGNIYNSGDTIRVDDGWEINLRARPVNGSQFISATSNDVTVKNSSNTDIYAKWFYMPAKDVTVKFTFSDAPAATTHTVSFDMKGHGEQVAAQTVNAGEKVTEPAEPTATGYIFGGWYKDSSFATAWNFDTDTVTADTTLYALWVQNTLPNTPYNVWVSGKQITSANKNDVLGDGKVSYDPDTQTLTVLDSTNINTPYVYDSYYGLKALIVSEGIDLTISAPNSLTLGNITDEGLAVYDGNLIINGNVNFTATNDGACAIFVGGGSVTINGNADIRFNGAVGESDTNAICATNGITITGDVTVNGFEYGLYSSAGNITVNGKAVINTENFALDARGTNGIAVDKDINITVSEINATAISASAGNVTVGGKADIQFTGASNENSNDAIYAYGNIAITGDVEIDGFYNGIRSNNGDITLNGSAAITAISIGIYAVEGKVVMVSGKWDINTGNKAIIAKTGIDIPSTHAVTMPENGKIKTVDDNYTVTEVNGSTVAKHVIIKQNTASTIYTVSFNMNGHGDQVADQMVNAGEKVTEPAEPTAIGYMFVGWYKDSAFNTVWNFDTDTVTENTTLYALWAQNIQKIIESINVNVTAPAVGSHPDYSPVITATPNEVTSLCKVYLTPAWICADTESDLYNGNGTVMTAADTFVAGKYYAFSIQVNTLDAIVAGWQRSSTIVVTINGSVIDSLNHNVLVNTFGEDIGWLRAAWKMPDAGATATYTVNFNMNGHGTQVEAQTVKEGEKATKPADPTASGWTFDGWYADATFSAVFDFDTAIAADTTIYAKWTANSVTPPTPANYTVTFSMNGHGTQVAAQTVKEGEKATKPADPSASGYTFDGWYADATFSAKFDFDSAITANTTVYAKWTEVKKDEPTKPADPTNPTQPTKPADPTSPQTGDNSHLFLWVALLFISGSALVGTAVYGKKRKYSAK